MSLMSPSNIAADVANDLRTGVPARRTLDLRAIVADPSWPTTFASYLTPLDVDGTSFDAVTITATGTPVDVVAESAQKPNAAQVTVTTTTLKKHAGRATFTLEASLSAAGLTGAVYNALAGQALSSMETDIVSVLGGSNGHGYPTADAAAYIQGILEAQGKIMAAGGNPSLIAVSPADVAKLGSTMMNARPEVGMSDRVWGGARIHVTAALAAGNAMVLDPNGATLAVNVDSPAVIVDPYTRSSHDETTITVDLLAGCVLTVPELVVPVSHVPAK